MPAPPSRYHPDAAPDYGHRFHAGNVGDVWKHCALVEVLRLVSATPAPVRYLDTHAGEGHYRLAPTGEWSEGIGRLWAAGAVRDDAVARYVALCRSLGAGAERPERYPGSPALARAVLGPSALLALWERDQTAFARLAAHRAGDANVRLTQGDGLHAMADEVRAAETGAGPIVVLIDPPWTQKADWTHVPDALAAAVRASTRACLVLWYPVKSLTRPNAMIARLQEAGVSGAIAELITTPLDHRRHRLNGSGVLLVRPPAAAIAALAAAAPVVGEHCATPAGTWSLRLLSWTAQRQ
ncbi:MAG: 23S rRNA (adenine(2030)-N(6))-methyltransferase RlmJ [Candidatus Binatia bacterium]